MKSQILPALKLTLALIVLLAFGYTLVVRGISLYSMFGGNGETVEKEGRIVGYRLIGQSFKSDKYFWGRPSSVDYNAAGSGGSNKGTNNPDYLKTVQGRIDTFLNHNPGVCKKDIPVELVQASGSGLDPDITPAAAFIQAPRIARVRNMNVKEIDKMISENTERPFLGIFGTTKVNVLKLNLELDDLSENALRNSISKK